MRIEQLSVDMDVWAIVEARDGTPHFRGSKVEVLSFYIGMVGIMGEA